MQKTVLVTGAGSGIGYDSVRNLISHGFDVVATVRKEADAENLRKSFGVKTLILDVADLKAVENLPQLLQKLGVTELFGLVNNAGVAYAGPFLNQDFAEIQALLQVNVLGLLKVTQVVLPFMLKQRGAIVNISSVAGKSAMPFLSIYAASKHAVEGFSEGLRRELQLFGIRVVVIAPGSIKTPIWQKGIEKGFGRYDESPFYEALQKFKGFAEKEEAEALPVSVVSDLVVEALTNESAQLRYSPVPPRRKFINFVLPSLIPAKLYDRLLAKAIGLTKR